MHETMPPIPRAKPQMNVSVVIPVYNSESTLDRLVSTLTETLRSCCAQYEIILVNDGSRDNSWAAISRLMNSHKELRGICLTRNFGQHNALLCGIRQARYEITVTLDDDLQNPAFEIPRLLAKLAEGYDVVYGTPIKQEHAFFRTLASRITKLVLSKALGINSAVNIYPFRAFRTNLRDAFEDYSSPTVFIDCMLAWGTSKFGSVKVAHHPRAEGASNYSILKLFSTALNMLTGFSVVPLRIASLNGLGFVILGGFALTYVIANYNYLIHGGAVPGFAFISCLMIIFSGAQLLALGIIGEYLARIHVKALTKPTYVIRRDFESLTDVSEISSQLLARR